MTLDSNNKRPVEGIETWIKRDDNGGIVQNSNNKRPVEGIETCVACVACVAASEADSNNKRPVEGIMTNEKPLPNLKRYVS